MLEGAILIFKKVVFLLVFLEVVDFFFETCNDDVLLVGFDSHVGDDLGCAHVQL